MIKAFYQKLRTVRFGCFFRNTMPCRCIGMSLAAQPPQFSDRLGLTFDPKKPILNLTNPLHLSASRLMCIMGGYLQQRGMPA